MEKMFEEISPNTFERLAPRCFRQKKRVRDGNWALLGGSSQLVT